MAATGRIRLTGLFRLRIPLTSRLLSWLVFSVAFFTIPVSIGYMYGVLGGGIHEYLKSRRLAQSMA